MAFLPVSLLQSSVSHDPSEILQKKHFLLQYDQCFTQFVETVGEKIEDSLIEI